jgi:hypothetical protein
MSNNILGDYASSMLSVAKDLSNGKETEKFMGRAGTELKKETINTANKKVKMHTGTYHKSIKKGKVWNRNGSVSVNVYSDDNKAHLIEKGHRIVDKAGNEKGFVKGEYVFASASETYSKEFEEDIEKFVDGLLDDLL